MSYTRLTNFAAKDALITGNAAKVVRGTELGAEFDALVVQDALNVKTSGALGTPSSGTLTNCTGTASGLTSGNVTTNANLTGVIISSGNATSIASQTGTGTKFVVDTSPTLVTPLLGTPTSGVATNLTGLPLTTGVTGTLPVANGGSGVTTSTGTGAVVLGTSPTLTTPVINSATVATVSGTAPLYMCRAWVNFNGTGTPAINASGNVSSITDNGTGDYTVNFTTAMSDANYSSVTTSSGGQAYNGTSAAGYAGILNVLPNTGSPYDATYINVAIFR